MLVERDAELAAIEQRLAQARKGSGGIVLVEAPAAFSSLSQALLDRGKLGVALDQHTPEAACATAPPRLNPPS